MASPNGNEDLKARMREALERKRANQHPDDGTGKGSKVHGPEVSSGAAGPKMHRRKAGGGGA